MTAKPFVRNVKVENLDNVLQRLDVDFLAQPEFDGAMGTFEKRIMRQGKGLGSQRNTLMVAPQSLMSTVTSTLNHPRTVGTSWGRKNEGIIKGMAPRVIKKVATNIEARWAGEATSAVTE